MVNTTTPLSVTLSWQEPAVTHGHPNAYFLNVTDDSGFCLERTFLTLEEVELEYKYPQKYGNTCNGTTVTIDGCGQVSYTVDGLSPDTEFTFTVYPVNGAGAGQLETLTAHTDIAVPNPPTNVTVQQINATNVNVTWDKPHPRPGPTNYTLTVEDLGPAYYHETMPGNSQQITISGYDKTSYEVSELSPFWRYTVAITAITSEGSSQPAVFGPFNTSKSAPGPAEFLNVTRYGASYTEVDVTWTCPPNRQRNTIITGFSLTVDTISTVRCPFSFKGKTPTPYQVISDKYRCEKTFSNFVWVEPEYGYLFKMRTLGTEYNSTEEATTNYTAPPGPSSQVEALKVHAVNHTAVNITWDLPEHPNGCLTAYVIQDFTTNCTGPVLTENFSHNDTSFIVGDLAPGMTCSISLTPYNKAGAGNTSFQYVTVPAGQSEAVKDLTIKTVNPYNVSLSWTKPDVTNGHLTAYVLVVNNSKTGSCLNWAVFSDEATEIQSVENGCAFTEVNGFPRNYPVSYTVDELPADTHLTVTVYAVNHWGRGLPDTFALHTPIAVPKQPTAFSVNPSGPHSVTVSWGPPQPRPGPTNYTLTVIRSNGPCNNQGYAVDRVINIPGYETSSVIVGSLLSGWTYQFQMKAVTSAGHSNPVTRQPTYMPESQPGQVQGLNVTQVETSYRQALVTWGYPERLHRHGNITNFTVSYFEENGNRRIPQQSYAVSAKMCTNTLQRFSKRVDVIPGRYYGFMVTANNEHFTGTDTTFMYTAPVGLPSLPTLPPDTTTSTKETSLARSQSTFSVSYCAPCLLDDTNGDITFVAAIVCAVEYCKNDTLEDVLQLSGESDVRDIPSWHTAQQEGFRKYYRPTEDDWQNHVQSLLARQKRATGSNIVPSVFVVGNDTSCPQTPDYVHCNGPLPAARAFRTTFVSCSSAGCTATALTEQISTLENPPDVVPGIVGGVLGAVTAVAVVVGVVLYRRRGAAKQGDRLLEREEELGEIPGRGRSILMRDFEEKLREWKTAKDANGFPTFFLTQFNVNDHSRVKLTQLDGDDTCDYINASYIPGHHSKREYIATQGPMESTVHDFWRMAWEQQAKVIVMLSGLKEKNLVKVHQYYPDDDQLDEPQEYGCVTVTLIKVQKMPDFLVRTFQLVVGGERRTVKHFCVDTWTDFDADLNASLVLEFAGTVRADAPPSGKHPIVVHCSIEKNNNGIEKPIGGDTALAKPPKRRRYCSGEAPKEEAILQWRSPQRGGDTAVAKPPKRRRYCSGEAPKEEAILHAGVGRTGTFIAVDYFMQYIRDKSPSDPIDIFGYVLSMRENRTNMVQTMDQYAFVHDVVAELIRRKTEVDP
ncbi:hypothetical protein BaRGS_00005519 [Batillaria attramentaria]|uniref:Protein-tyrosine-phosphatase n=1 Tax=Batillaria attramentaria TaxID=370345 RepID=A0ABD0LUH4_9CAEN